MQGRVPQISNIQAPLNWGNQMQQIFPKQNIIQQNIIEKAIYKYPSPVSSSPIQVKSIPKYQEEGEVEFIRQLNQGKIVAVIVSISEGDSYDKIFTTTQQKSEPGTQIVVATCSEKRLQDIYFRYSNPPLNRIDPPNVHQLGTIMNQVDADCVLINFECCQDYAYRSFKNKEILHIVYQFIQKGMMVMFSDFSLKCLIKEWDSKLFGQNPFILDKEGYNNGKVTLNFKPQSLKKSPSAQLQLLGSLSQQGKCIVNTSRDTIIYYVDRKKVNNKKFTVQILTQAILANGQKAVGHALLSFPSGGKILTSMTHWCELQNIHTTQEKVLEAAKINMGAQYVNQMRAQMSQQTPMQNQRFLQQAAQQIVQQSAPCNNMVQKLNYK